MSSAEYGQLVEFLGRQFADVDRQLAAMDLRFSQMIAELRQAMLGRFDEIYRRFERLEQEHQAITQGLRRIEAALADERGRREIIERDLTDLKQRVAALQLRIDAIEARFRS
jgi:chromosome segregation ATPase